MTLIGVVEAESGKKGLTLSSRLDELGLDSLEFVELMLEVSRVFKDIPDAEWSQLETIGDIAAKLETIQ